MPDRKPSDADAAPGLAEISTRWPLIRDPVQFVLRYAPAIRAYLVAMLRDDHDADDLAQDFLVKGLQHGFVRAEPLRGRFRDYLKVAVRNAALTHLQRRRPVHAVADLDRVPAAGEPAAGREWLAEWRRCLIDRTLQALEREQPAQSGNLFYTAMSLHLAHPDEDSAALATRAGELAGRAIRPDAFRKQLSRARRRFAELLVAEV